MAALDMSATMDAIAAAVPTTATQRRHAWPVETATPPCAIVGYPTDIDFDATFGRGSDKAVFPLWLVVGKVADKAARDALSEIITGAKGIKDAIDGDLGGAVQTARVTNCTPDTIVIGAVTYLSARFDIEVFS